MNSQTSAVLTQDQFVGPDAKSWGLTQLKSQFPFRNVYILRHTGSLQDKRSYASISHVPGNIATAFKNSICVF